MANSCRSSSRPSRCRQAVSRTAPYSSTRVRRPVGEARHAQGGQPVEQLGHVQGGDQRAGRLGHQCEPALRALGPRLCALGVGPGLLRDRPGQLGLLPRRLLGGESRLALTLHADPLGDVGLHADEAHQLPSPSKTGLTDSWFQNAVPSLR